MKRLVLPVALLLLFAIPAPIFTAPAGNPDFPMRKRMADGEGDDPDPAVTCRVRYYYSCAISKRCVEDSHAGACCNECRDYDGTLLPCSPCVAN